MHFADFGLGLQSDLAVYQGLQSDLADYQGWQSDLKVGGC